MKTMKKSMASLIFLLVAISVLTACSTSTSKEMKKDSTTSSADEEAPIVIQHALGETVLKQKPERIVTIAWGNQDIALALGVVPVGFSAANYGVQDDSGMLPWTAEKLKELGEPEPIIFQDTDGLDFEAISDANPDVILAAYSGITQEDYDMLNEIAPVVAYPEAPWVITWREQIMYNAKGMAMEEEGIKLISDIEQFMQDTVKKYPEVKGKKAAFTMFNATDLSKFYVYTLADPRGEMLEEIGMIYPESIQKAVTDSSSFYMEMSAENADVLDDADILITYGHDKTLATLQADPILGKVPAIQNGAVVVIGDNTPLAAAGTPSPLSIPYTMDEYLSLISEVAKKLK